MYPLDKDLITLHVSVCYMWVWVRVRVHVPLAIITSIHAAPGSRRYYSCRLLHSLTPTNRSPRLTALMTAIDFYEDGKGAIKRLEGPSCEVYLSRPL